MTSPNPVTDKFQLTATAQEICQSVKVTLAPYPFLATTRKNLFMPLNNSNVLNNTE